jgi:hypothetical protein
LSTLDEDSRKTGDPEVFSIEVNTGRGGHAGLLMIAFSMVGPSYPNSLGIALPIKDIIAGNTAPKIKPPPDVLWSRILRSLFTPLEQTRRLRKVLCFLKSFFWLGLSFKLLLFWANLTILCKSLIKQPLLFFKTLHCW